MLFSPARTPGKMEEEEVCYDKELLPPFDGDYYDVWLPADLSRRAELNGRGKAVRVSWLRIS